jgi:hypothetical protein
MAFEDEYMDVLHNIELAIIQIYSEHPELVDSQVDTAINSLIRVYAAEQRGRNAPKLRLSELEKTVYDHVEALCGLHLGRETMTDESGKPLEDPPEIPVRTPEEIIACLKRIRKSIKLWTKELGRQGYLNYIKQFLPG